jgi:myo-inositol-1(or 4)-monophosphatase
MGPATGDQGREKYQINTESFIITPMNTTMRDYMNFAAETVWQAGRLTLAHFQTGVQPEWKADDSPVTIADREAEQFMRRHISATYPGHDLIGEEFGANNTSGASHIWYIDPIDGTKSFIRGVPFYAVLLGLEIEGRVEVGAVYFPPLDELLVAATGVGCWWNGRPARVSGETDLSRSMVCHIDTASFARHSRGAAWQRLQAAGYYNAGWCDAYGYALVATGRAEVMLDPIISPWDGAPFPAIFREAGGYYGDWQGRETIHQQEALATTPALLPQVLAVLNGD